jgi:hypothetical protein
MTDPSEYNEDITPAITSDSESDQPVIEGIVELGGNPRMATTIKAWPPGKPPGGKLPLPQPEAKAPQDKSS